MTAAAREQQAAFGVVAIDGKEAVIAWADGDDVHVCTTLACRNMRRTRRGGQSALRFDRLRDGAESAFIIAVAEAVNTAFAPPTPESGEKALSGLLLGGPASLKHQLAGSMALAPALKQLICATVDTSCSGRPAVAEILRATSTESTGASDAPARAALARFSVALARGDDDLLLYGLHETVSAVEAHAAAEVLVSSHAHAATRVPTTAPATGEEHVPLLEWLRDACAVSSAKLHIMQAKTEQAMQFAQLGGAAAFLRFPFKLDEEPDSVARGDASNDLLDEIRGYGATAAEAHEHGRRSRFGDVSSTVLSGGGDSA